MENVFLSLSKFANMIPGISRISQNFVSQNSSFWEDTVQEHVCSNIRIHLPLVLKQKFHIFAEINFVQK
jgi:hypothetical protein